MDSGWMGSKPVRYAQYHPTLALNIFRSSPGRACIVNIHYEYEFVGDGAAGVTVVRRGESYSRGVGAVSAWGPPSAGLAMYIWIVIVVAGASPGPG